MQVGSDLSILNIGGEILRSGHLPESLSLQALLDDLALNPHDLVVEDLLVLGQLLHRHLLEHLAQVVPH